MKRYLHIISLYIVCLLLPGCSDPVELTPLSSNSVVLAFGDSLTYGTGAGHKYGYPTHLQKLLGSTVINAGVPGELTQQGLKRLPKLLQEHRPDLVILCHGGNDILQRRSSQQTRDNLALMINTIQQHGAEVVMIGIPEFGLFPNAAKYYGELAENFQLAAELEVIPRLETHPRYKSDAVHFNREGYRLLAEAVYQLLSEHGALVSEL